MPEHCQRQLIGAIIASLTPELLKKRYRNVNCQTKIFKASYVKSRVFGHCYIASEALYHMLGGKRSGYAPQVMRYKGGTHWFLRHRISGRILDVTKRQFVKAVSYEQGKGCGFLTTKPSRNAQIVILRAGKHLRGIEP